MQRKVLKDSVLNVNLNSKINYGFQAIAFVFSISIPFSTSYADYTLWKSPSLQKASLIEKADQELARHLPHPQYVHAASFLFSTAENKNQNSGKYAFAQVLQNAVAATVKYAQSYKGIPVLGLEAMVHFDSNGDVHDVSERQIVADLNEKPKLTAEEATQILQDRYKGFAKFDGKPELLVFKDSNDVLKLVYRVLTKTGDRHLGQEVYLDAQTGALLIEADRNYDMQDLSGSISMTDALKKMNQMVTKINVKFKDLDLPQNAYRGKRTVYTADTPRAKEFIDSDGYPMVLSLVLYDKLIEDGTALMGTDRSAVNAYRTTGKVYDYYNKNFNYKSFDNKDSRIKSVVHVGTAMNNAFWSSEDEIMAFGDGDGVRLQDLTYGLDVTAHELTHGVTGTTAKLVYAAESGALNESYSDFFGKMVDYDEDNWDIGRTVMASGSTRRAIRNMKDPTEFKQPDRMSSPLKIPTNEPCTYQNDRCGVHANSGIPNRAGYLIVQSIGKSKAEKIYFNVLTRRLTATSNFREARIETEKECALQLGADTTDCKAVKAAFDTVEM